MSTNAFAVVSIIAILDAGFDFDAGCCVQDVTATDGTTTVTAKGVVWNGDDNDDGYVSWFAEAVAMARAGVDGYTLA